MPLFSNQNIKLWKNDRRFANDIFKCISLEKKSLYSDINFIEVCSQWSNWQNVTIGSDNGLAPNRRQAIIWTNNGLVYRGIYTSSNLIVNNS